MSEVLVMVAHEQLEIGSTYKGVTDVHNKPHYEMPFKVLREVTAKEYFECLEQQGTGLSFIEVAMLASHRHYYYEISID